MNKLINGDCFEAISELEDNSIDLVVTDPPYELGKTGGGAFGDKKAYHEEIGFISNGFDYKIFDELVKKMKKINIYVFCSQKQIPILRVFNSIFSCFKICIINLNAYKITFMDL